MFMLQRVVCREPFWFFEGWCYLMYFIVLSNFTQLGQQDKKFHIRTNHSYIN